MQIKIVENWNLLSSLPGSLAQVASRLNLFLTQTRFVVPNLTLSSTLSNDLALKSAKVTSPLLTVSKLFLPSFLRFFFSFWKQSGYGVKVAFVSSRYENPISRTWYLPTVFNSKLNNMLKYYYFPSLFLTNVIFDGRFGSESAKSASFT